MGRARLPLVPCSDISIAMRTSHLIKPERHMALWQIPPADRQVPEDAGGTPKDTNRTPPLNGQLINAYQVASISHGMMGYAANTK